MSEVQQFTSFSRSMLRCVAAVIHVFFLASAFPARGQKDPQWWHQHGGTVLPCKHAYCPQLRIKYGCILPLTGEKGPAGLAEQLAIQMAIEDYSKVAWKQGTIGLTCVDTQCNPDKSAAAMRSLTTRQGVVAVVGDICSGASTAAAVVANEQRVPLISAASGASSLSQVDYFYRTVPSDSYQGLAAAHLVSSKGGKKVGMLLEETVYGTGLAENFNKDFVDRHGGEVPVTVKVQQPADPTPQEAAQQAVATFKAAVASGTIDSVFLSSNNNTLVAAFLIAAATQQLNLPLFGGGGVTDPSLFKLVEGSPNDLGRLTASTVSPGKQDFIDRFMAASKNAYGYHPGVSRAYDAMRALLRAADRVGSPRRGRELRAKLQAQSFEGVSGPIAFDQYGDLIPTDDSYVALKFNMETKEMEYLDPIKLD